MRCDVLVVGAGPGGSTAAYWLSRFGADVLLVDKAHFPRNKPCGDALGPGVEEMLLSMGLGDLLVASGCRYEGLRLYYPDLDFRERSHNTALELKAINGWTVPRYLLDDALRRNAEAAGARFLEGFTALSPLYRGERVCGISGVHKGLYLTIEAPLTIIATGANRKLIQEMGFCDEEPARGLGLRVYVPNREEMEGSLQVYLEEELFPAYAWVFPGPDNCANVGCGIFLEGRTPELASHQLRSTLRHLVQQKSISRGEIPFDLLPQKPQGFPIRSDFPHIPVYQPGAMVVGEAAGLVDPITGEGIYTALRSGWLAARVASFALDTSDFSVEPLKVYGDILQEWYGAHYEAARQFMRWLSRPGMEASLIRQTKENPQVQYGLEEALLRKHPAEGLSILQENVTLPG